MYINLIQGEGMGLKIGKQNSVSQSVTIQDSSEVKKTEVSKGIANIRDAFESEDERIQSSASFFKLFLGRLIGYAIKEPIDEVSTRKNQEEMRTDVQQTQEVMSNLSQSAQLSSSVRDDDDLNKNIARS
jgi:hypothetical protein